MNTRVTTSRLFGREPELDRVEQLLARSLAELRPSILLVGGEAGIGKTHFASTAVDRAEAAGATVLRGQCIEFAGEDVAYAPLVGMLGAFAATRPTAFERVSAAQRADLATLVPVLEAAPAQRDGPLGPVTAQARLFSAVTGLLAVLSTDGQVVVLLEDVHWADESTRAFLSFLAAHLADAAVVVICTYRTDAMHRRHPLQPLLSGLRKNPRSEAVAIEPLTRKDIGSLVADITGQTPTTRVVDRVFARSEGNPLFAEELLAVDPQAAGRIPPTVREAFMTRVAALGPQTQRVLRLASVAGWSQHATLAAAWDESPTSLEAGLREAADAGIVVVRDDHLVGLRHALLAEAIGDDLLPGERAALHLAVARALERRAAGPGAVATPPGALAAHYLAAGHHPEALAACLDAAWASRDVAAYPEASRHFERAIELWPLVTPDARPSTTTLGESVARAAEALTLGGDTDRAQSLLERGLQDPEASTEPRDRATLLEVQAVLASFCGRADQSREALDEALELFAADDMSDLRARLVFARALDDFVHNRLQAVIDGAPAGIALARRAGTPDLVDRHELMLGECLVKTGATKAGLELLGSLPSRAHGDLDAAFASANLATCLAHVGRVGEALLVQLDAMARYDVPGIANDWMAINASRFALLAGDAPAARLLLPDRERVDGGRGRAFADLMTARLALWEGDQDGAMIALEQVAAYVTSSGEPHFLAPLCGLRAELALRGRQRDDAREAIDQAFEFLDANEADVLVLSELSEAGAAIAAADACHHRDVGDRAAAFAFATRAETLTSRVGEAPHFPAVTARRATAAAHVACAAGAPAAPAFEDAATAWLAAEQPYAAAQCSLRAAEEALAAGDRAAAAANIRAAGATSDALGAPWLATRVRSLAARAHVRLTAPPQPAGEHPSQPADAYGMTAREREVLVLVAAGARNREIGEALFMAEKTASVHVSRILAKLGVSTRTQAAALAHRQGLAGTPGEGDAA